jgi:hypothetical protein
VAEARRALEESSGELLAHLVHLAAGTRDDDAGRPAHDALRLVISRNPPMIAGSS